MKFILAVALLCIGAVAAQTAAPQHPGRQMAEALEKRGAALLAHVRAILTELGHSGHRHLAGALDHEFVLIEALLLDLKHTLGNPKEINAHHVHVIEETLLHMENSVSEQIHLIEEAKKHHTTGQTVEQLISKGQALVKQAEEALLHHERTPEARHIQHELAEVQNLLKHLAGHPTGQALTELEHGLVLHEKSLQNWLEKAAHRGDQH